MTIEDFIAARLDEDEHVAAGARRGPQRPDWSEDYGREFIVVVGVRDGVPDCAVRSTDESRHIARHDPARVLRQVEAIRAMLTLYATHRVYGPPWEDSELDTDGPDRWTGADEVFEALLGPIAAIWSDHPDFLPEWNTP